MTAAKKRGWSSGIAAMAIAATAVLLGAGAASAQYVEGNHQVRAGFFLGAANADFDVHRPDRAAVFVPTPPGGNPVLQPPYTIPAVTEAFGSGNAKGMAFGASGGLEWIRAGSMAWGLEVDVAAHTGKASMGLTPDVKAGVNYFASLRGRLGFFARPELFIYGTGGVAAVGTEVSESNAAKINSTHIGGVYGAGMELHRGATIFFLEYLHADFGSKSGSFTTGTVAGNNVSTRDYNWKGDVDMIRVGVKFKVGHDWKDDHRHPDHLPPMK